MHVSLDSALGRQRRLNSVGESVLQIAPSATAAYSLRSLTGGDPKVVRVRRGSDNHEQDFTASGVSSGALTSFVNAQVVAPLDIQALSATGRDGDFLIAKAAYSLRSLGTRQATLTSSGDTDGDTSDKFVVQVRRSSDDKIKSFTANQVGTSGSSELEDFCDEATPARNRAGGAKYSSFSTDGVTGFSAVCSSAAAAGYDIFGASSTAVQVSFDIVLNSGTVAVKLRPEFETGSDVSNQVTIDSSGSKSFTLTSTAEFKALQFISGATDFVVSNFSVNVPYNHSAFVKTWYDQSVTTQAGDTATGNHAVQATAASQPKIVNAGSLLNELDFDGTDDTLDIDFGADLSQANSFFMVHQSDTLNADANEFFDRISGSPRTLLDQSGSDYRMLSESSVGTGVAVTTDKSLIFALYNGASSLLAKNGTATSALNTGTAGINQNSSLGASASQTRFYDGTMQEFIVYNSDQTDNRTAIEANIGEVYSIDLPSGVDPGFDQVDGFVETWYDQSGNGNNAVQATAGSQPKIVSAGTFLSELLFEGSQVFDTITLSDSAQPNSIFTVSNTNVASQTHGIYGTNQSQAGYYRSSNKHAIFSTGTGSATLEGGAYVADRDYLRFDLFNGASSVVGVDGNTTSGTTGDEELDRLDIGDSTLSGVNPLNGGIKELILYTSDQTDNRTALETNIAAEYGITLS